MVTFTGFELVPIDCDVDIVDKIDAFLTMINLDGYSYSLDAITNVLESHPKNICLNYRISMKDYHIFDFYIMLEYNELYHNDVVKFNQTQNNVECFIIDHYNRTTREWLIKNYDKNIDNAIEDAIKLLKIRSELI